jgi:hypothetical protein
VRFATYLGEERAVKEAAGPVAEGMITNEMLRIAGWETEDAAGNPIAYEALLLKIWRTLVAN